MTESVLQRPLHLQIPSSSPSASAGSSKSFSSHSSLPIDPSSPLAGALCARCKLPFGASEVFISTESKNWHSECFRCAQCFSPLHQALYFLVDGRNYCEHDFKTLFAPSCAKCKKFIMGRVIKTVNQSWHPDCLRCEQCGKALDTEGVWRHAGRNLCMQCSKDTKKEGGKLCAKCNTYIERGKEIRYKSEDYHPCHFNCQSCKVELDENARQLKDDLYCPRCYDRLCLTCAACRHPIDNERSVFALGKHWHIDHFMCGNCEKPFYGSKYFERKGRAYCESCYLGFVEACFKCGSKLTGGRLTVFSKSWCPECYACFACDRPFGQKSKVIEMDMKPVCKKCYDRFPKELKLRMTKA